MTLRVTQGYRLMDAEWRVMHRHADVLTEDQRKTHRERGGGRSSVCSHRNNLLEFDCGFCFERPAEPGAAGLPAL
jgi:hypothetical protein